MSKTNIFRSISSRFVKQETNKVISEQISMKNKGSDDMMKKYSSPQHYLFWNYSEREARDLCKHQLDSLEHWSRRLIDETFRESYTDNYFDYEMDNNQPLVKKEIRKRVEGRIKDNPGKFPRKIDALVIEDLEYFFCRDDLYHNHFKQVFEPFYTSVAEVRNVFQKISNIRNTVSHANPISKHEVEQCVCYSNDIMNLFKEYYIKMGKEEDYNVPVFIRVSDCFGNSLMRKDPSFSWSIFSRNFANQDSSGHGIHLRAGETYRFEVEVDASFPDDFYKVEWYAYYRIDKNLGHGYGKIIEFTANEASVSSSITIRVELVTKRKWHRFGNIKADDLLEFHLDTVLPPIEDTY